MAVLDRLDTSDNLRNEDPQALERHRLKKFGWEEDVWRSQSNLWIRWKPKLWSLFDEPYSSTTAKVILLKLLKTKKIFKVIYFNFR